MACAANVQNYKCKQCPPSATWEREVEKALIRPGTNPLNVLNGTIASGYVCDSATGVDLHMPSTVEVC